MKINLSKPKFRKKIRAKSKQIASLGESINKHIDRHIFRRWGNLQNARRFAIGWVALLLILITGVLMQSYMLPRHYLELAPVAGGYYTEGDVGNFDNGNPIYATGSVDASASKLIFSSLLTYDNNGNLKGDLAKSWKMEPNSRIYYVKLKPNLKWHDGQPLTADDIVFTYQTIQNPQAKSPLMSGWKGIKVEKIDAENVKFTLPSPYVPFPNNLTTGIIPKHILGNIKPENLRSDAFNTKKLIGSGPFIFKSGSENNSGPKKEIKLLANKNYHLSPPKLAGFSIFTYKNSESLKSALSRHEIISAGGLTIKDADITAPEKTPFVQNSATMLFLKNSSPNLVDTKVRQALTRGTKTADINNKLGYDAVAVKEPLLSNQPGYNDDYWQLSYNKEAAEKLLNEAGWLRVDGKQYRQKDGKELTLKLVSENNDTYPALATEIQKQWAQIGVKLDVSFVTADQITQTYIPNHEYDVFLYGINIGKDPDVYAYWHSAQAVAGSSRLNLSEYKSTIADIALESARSRANSDLRAAKYKPFLAAWKNDAPAIGLYQPRYLYLSNQPVYNIYNNRSISSPEGRFNNVNEWMINTSKVQKK